MSVLTSVGVLPNGVEEMLARARELARSADRDVHPAVFVRGRPVELLAAAVLALCELVDQQRHELEALALRVAAHTPLSNSAGDSKALGPTEKKPA